MLFSVILTEVAVGQVGKNSLKLGFRQEVWESGFPNRQLFNLTYGRKINEHELFFRTNIMSFNNDLGAQFIVDYYPKFNEKSYGFASLAYSNFNVFPRFRLAGEYFRIFGTWETSIGARYSNTIDNNIIGFTLMAGKYYGNWFSYFRPIFSFVDGKFAEGFLLSTRRYFATKYQFAEALVYWGNDTGEISDLSTLNLGLKYFLIRGSYQHGFKNNILLNVGMDYSGYFNSIQDRYVKVISVDISILKSF